MALAIDYESALRVYVTKLCPRGEWLDAAEAMSIVQGPVDRQYEEMRLTKALRDHFGHPIDLGASRACFGAIDAASDASVRRFTRSSRRSIAYRRPPCE